MTKKEFWLKLFTENDTALASAIHLCERFVSNEQLMNGEDFLVQKREELYEEIPLDVIKKVFGREICEFWLAASTTMKRHIEAVISICNKLDFEKEAKISGFGKSGDLTLFILKNGEYDFKNEKACSWFYTIHTIRNGKLVDDTSDAYINDSNLKKELERLWDYKHFNLARK